MRPGPPVPALALAALLAAPLPAFALTLSLQGTSSPAAGITISEYRTTSPGTNTWVAEVDLCTNRIYVDATRAPSNYQSTGGWGGDIGAELATNGDFYVSGPQVYGDAVGGGVRWPLDQLGLNPANSGEWYFERHGWVAFGHDQVWYTHSRWVKLNTSGFPALAGWEPTVIAPDPPPGTLALVSGFPGIVIEGFPRTCASPTATTCFPDRSDMRSRHPRTAMGLSQDLSTFYLAVVDGRTSASSGMYGSELADLMSQLGAWNAFNLDGGGSSQFWVAGEGYLNDVDGNNNGNGTRSVTNHWGVFGGTGNGLPTRPGHCVTAPPCGTVPAGGTTIEEDTPCFRKFGDPTYWRTETNGSGGHLWWTNAFDSEQPDNWASWQLHFEEAGLYEVEYWADASFSVYEDTIYGIRASGVDHEVISDQGAAAGWRSLGTFDFAAGGQQWAAVHDHHDGSVAANQHVSADAIRITRAEPYCGDTTCDTEEHCGSCAADCPPVAEVPGNGLDDNCDGTVDEEPPPGDDDTTSDDDTAPGDDDSNPSDDDTSVSNDDTTDDDSSPDSDDDSTADDDTASADDDSAPPVVAGPRPPRPGIGAEGGCSCAGGGGVALSVLAFVRRRRRSLAAGREIRAEGSAYERRTRHQAAPFEPLSQVATSSKRPLSLAKSM